MGARASLPLGMTPRLLSRDAAATYCGVTAETFEQHVRPHVSPIEIGARACGMSEPWTAGLTCDLASPTLCARLTTGWRSWGMIVRQKSPQQGPPLFLSPENWG